LPTKSSNVGKFSGFMFFRLYQIVFIKKAVKITPICINTYKK